MNGKKIYLIVWDRYSKDRFRKTDSTNIKNSFFEFKGTLAKPCEEAYVMVKEKGNFFYFVLDSGKTKMHIRPLPPQWPTHKNKLSNIAVDNSLSNSINDSLRTLKNQYYLKFGRPAPNTNGIIKLNSARSKELWLKELAIIEKHPDQYYSLIYLYKLLLQRRSEATRIENVYEQLDPALKKSVLGEELYNKIKVTLATQVGHPIFEFSGNTVTGAEFSNNSLAGKIYLIAFGATWCKPCKENYPLLKDLYKKYKKNGFEIVDINMDDKKEVWVKQIKSFDLNWTSISELKKWEESLIVKQSGIDYIPFYLLVDKTGIIIYSSSEFKDSKFLVLDNIIKMNID